MPLRCSDEGSNLLSDEDLISFNLPIREPSLRRVSSFSDVRSSPMHLDPGEICPMLTRLHVVTSQHHHHAQPHVRDDSNVTASARNRRIRSRSLGQYEEASGPSTILMPLEQPILSGLLYGASPAKRKPDVPSARSLPSPMSLQDSFSPINSAVVTSLDQPNPVWISVLYGLINAVIVLPVLMSFGSIIYRDEAFVPYMPVLVKLTVVSGMIHQVCFSLLSSLPFAVGQVQDAGLIFLSSMARDMVQYCQTRGYDDETMLATVTIGLGLATLLLGFGLVLVGRLRLAQYVQMLPTCVIGGYLAFIGWFCGMSGLELMAGGGDMSMALFADKIVYLLPGIAGGLFIYVLVRRLQHMAVLPMCIGFLFVLFYVVLFATNTTLEEATTVGWIRKSDEPPVWYHTWDYLNFDKVIWSAFPGEILTLLSMIFVVALSSSLDVAAIELEVKRPLDYNHELTTVGISNILSGALGGYTGSYIFSQSIFSLRAGIRSRLAGYVLAFCELMILVMPFPILSYVPNFFFGSLLVMICMDLLYEWLWIVRDKVTGIEYGICLVTFALIQVIGVEYGILAGVVLYVACRKMGLDVGDGDSSKTVHVDEEGEEAISLHPNTLTADPSGASYGATSMRDT